MTIPQEDSETSQKISAKKASPKRHPNICCNPGTFLPVAKDLKTTDGEKDGIGNFNDKLWEVGFKTGQDGSPHCGTIAVREPFMSTPLTETLGFPSPPQYGHLNFSYQALYKTIESLHLQGKQIAVHCHGERSSEQILKIFEQVSCNQ